MPKAAQVLAILACVCAAAAAQAADATLHTEGWTNTDPAFEEFRARIEKTHPRNLLARRKVRIAEVRGVGLSAARALLDGMAGERGGAGRVGMGGAPSVVTFYLGEPKVVTEVGVFTFNIDARANQDYEVRFANNSQYPGKAPAFPDKPHVTTGDKVIGPDRGGYHSAFRRKGGDPIVPGKVDWVQFRIWRTYNVKAGAPAKAGNTAQSWTSAIEFEVLGTAGDIVKISSEEMARRKAIRKLPKAPKYEKKATWQETMVAAREAIVEWEIEQDRFATPDSGADFGPWHVLGPLPANDPVVAEVERAKRIDLGKPLKAKDGKPIAWHKRDDFKDGAMIDLSKHFKANEGDVAFLCRDVTVTREFDRRHPYALSLGMYWWYTRLLPNRRTKWASKPYADPYPNKDVWQWQVKPGRYQVLIRTAHTKAGKWQVWFMPMPPTSRPGGGSYNSRVGRREGGMFSRLRRDFTDPASREQMKWEELDSIWTKFRRGGMSRIDRFVTDWPAGNPDFLNDQYAAAIAARAAELENESASQARRDAIVKAVAALKHKAEPQDIAARRAAYYALATIQEALAQRRRAESLRLAVEDQRDTFGERYPNSAENLGAAAALDQRGDAGVAKALSKGGDALADVLALRDEIDRVGQQVLLDNPLLRFDKLLVVTGGARFSSNWGGANRLGRKIEVLSPVTPDGKLTTIYEGGVSSLELSWDAKKILFSDGQRIFEINADGSGLRRITKENREVRCYDPCRLPNGKIVFVSTACEQAVPCTGSAWVGNLHIMDDDGANERRLTYDQDHDWNPTVMHDGRVLYTRWEYNDTPHYFTRLLFQMYPDGSSQTEYYGSNSYWPNAMYWPLPIPGHPSRIVCVVSGHHGVSREGELVILDPALGRHEADGVVQRIPGRGKKVEPAIMDGLVSDSWPRFAAPWPLAEPVTNAGAGKYFLANVRMDRLSSWGLYLVDVFDNMTPIKMGHYSTPIPLRARPRPPVIEDRVRLGDPSAVVYLMDVYQGGGLRGYPRGSIKALRISSVHYRFAGNGDTRAASYEGGWDVKKILGTVPVHEDGSAMFRVPANTPIVVQPLDAGGKAQQQMRSWFTAMPGERLSCVGCHEPQNAVVPNVLPLAAQREPAAIKPWHGPVRGFSFDREVQPVLDRRCAGCHDGRPGRLDFRAKRLHEDYRGPYSPAYNALHPYVRRAGYEADYHMLSPAEFEADTSPLVQMLKKGHHNVRLSREDWNRLYTWIDLNIPYPANWRESHRPPKDDQVARRVKYKKLHAGIDDRDEEPLPLPSVAKFEPPPSAGEQKPARPAGSLANWPFDAAKAAELQKGARLKPCALDLGSGVALDLVPVPAGEFVMGDPKGFPDERPAAAVRIEKPFWIGKFEVTNEQYAQFDSTHDSGYMEGRFKDRYTRGTPVNGPRQPVVRISWHEAMAFCAWLSKKTGRECSLPTEAQWEWACRGGTASPFAFGEPRPGLRDVANLSDSRLGRWNWGRVESDYSDGAMFSAQVGRYKPNAWGLHDMHGNVAEWTRTTYKLYPYDPADGRDAAPERGQPVLNAVRGGSWNDTFRFSRSASRWRYSAHTPVYNVGFRVVCLSKRAVAAAK